MKVWKYAEEFDLCWHTVRKNTEALLIASKEIGSEVNAEKTKYMVMCRDQNAGQVMNRLKLWNSLNIWEQP
jgi:hypothetical protein